MGKCLSFVRGRMSRSRIIFSLLAASIAVLVAMYVVLTRNQAAGLHPVEADSISIPLIEGFLTIGLVFVVSCVGLLVPSRGALRVFGVLLSAVAPLLSENSVWTWFAPLPLRGGCCRSWSVDSHHPGVLQKARGPGPLNLL